MCRQNIKVWLKSTKNPLTKFPATQFDLQVMQGDNLWLITETFEEFNFVDVSLLDAFIQTLHVHLLQCIDLEILPQHFEHLYNKKSCFLQEGITYKGLLEWHYGY